MSVFYQHIGQAMWARDAPISLGSENELQRFKMSDLEGHLSDISPLIVDNLKILETSVAPTGFQIWGLPSGAERIIRNMSPGDYLLLLENEYFRYAGQVIYHLNEPSWNLSNHLWGEQRFPLIVFLQGQIIKYSWDTFKFDFDFNPRYHMRGNTMRLSSSKIAKSRFDSEERFMAALFKADAALATDAEAEFDIFATRAEAHLRHVRDRAGQASFRDQVLRKQGARCVVCDFAIPEGLEAAHLVPKNENGSDDARNGLAFCALHHRLFDRGVFRIDPDTLEIVAEGVWTLSDLRITKRDIKSVKLVVHETALRWVAENRAINLQ